MRHVDRYLVGGVAIVVAGFAVALTAQQSSHALFERARLLEDSNQDLAEAISLYGQVVDQANGERALAATAQLRMGLIYERLGRPPDAQRAFEAVVSEFADHADAATRARTRLAALTQSGSAPSVTTLSTRLVFGSGSNTSASLAMPSADGRHVFVTDWDGGGDLAMQEIATGEMRRLTDERPSLTYGGFAMSALPSPDGTQVVMSWLNMEYFWELRLVGLEGGPVRTLYRNEEVSWVAAVGWTPDGSQILAQLGRTDGTNQIALISTADGSARALKSTDWRAPSPSLSPDGRYVAYDFPPQEESTQKDIFLLAADGSRAATLVEHPANDFSPVWMPDGSGILFLSDRTGASDLWLLEIEGGQPHGLPRLVKRSMGQAIPRGFTRDGSLFYGIRQPDNDVYTLTIDPDEGQTLEQPRKVSQKHEGFNSAPDWSSDGQYLVYRSRRGISPTGSDPTALIVRSVETGSERELVVPQLRYRGRPRWSPDGGSILAVGADTRGRNTLYRVDAATGAVQALAVGADVGDVWGVRGETVFYQRGQELVAHDLDTGDVRVVYDGEARNVALSPDGRRIAFKTQRSQVEGPISIVVVPASGGETRDLFTFESGHLQSGLAWTTNQDLLFTVEERSGNNINTTTNTELWRVSADGGEPEPLGALENLQGMVRHMAVHPDGRRVAFTLDNGYVDELWVLENLVASIKGER